MMPEKGMGLLFQFQKQLNTPPPRQLHTSEKMQKIKQKYGCDSAGGPTRDAIGQCK